MLAHDLFVARNPGDEEDQRHGDHSVDHGGHHQRLNRIDADKVDHQADERSNGDHAVKSMRALQLQVKARTPVECLGKRVGGRSREDRHGKKPQSDDPDGEYQLGQKPRVRKGMNQRLQRLGRLGCACDMSDAIVIQHRCGNYDNAPRRDLRRQHAQEVVDAEPLHKQLGNPWLSAVDHALAPLFFYLL